jgi:ribonuclease Z
VFEVKEPHDIANSPLQLTRGNRGEQEYLAFFVLPAIGLRTANHAAPMKPVYHPSLVNDVFGDPAVYVDFLFEKYALLFDLGDLSHLATRKILRLRDIFVSHAHMDHFFGFDWMLRLCLGRDMRVRLFGPPGFLRQVEAKLAAYTWNLVENYDTDFTLDVTEILTETNARSACFRCRTGFQREAEREFALSNRTLLREENFTVRFTFLDHKIPCLAFALRENQHVNIWKNRLDQLGLEPGPWLQVFKRALLRGEPGDSPITATRQEGGALQEVVLRLDELAASIANISTGQKVAYVTDAVYHEANAERIVELARGADQLFIEAVFGEELTERAAQKYHLTAPQSGTLARLAGAKFAIPFHFSLVYHDREGELRRQFEQAFRGDHFARAESETPRQT